MAQTAESGLLVVEGARIEWAAWGQRGNAGVLLVTGNGAHLGWWRPIAPFLATQYRVATLSWSGMGRSDWREAYSPGLFADEALSVAQTAGLFDGARKPVIVGHSFGGIVTMLGAIAQGDRLSGALLLDARLHTRAVWGADAEPAKPRRIYPSREEAIARFHLQPLQPERNRFILEALAEEALEAVEGGWRWRADPDIRRKTNLGDTLDNLIGRASCPLVFVRGDLTTTATDEVWAEHKQAAPPGTPFVEIPDAYHHVMIDQPIALAATLRALLATLDWRKGSRTGRPFGEENTMTSNP
jgi:pimeloyl-ACP methyl ester carboxylesterase